MSGRTTYRGAQAALQAARAGKDMPLDGPVRANPAPKRRKTVVDPRYDMSEAVFRKQVIEALEERGFVVWYVTDSRRMKRGLPDLLFWSPLRPGRLYAYELKKQDGKKRPDQVKAIAHLETVAGIDARFVRPADWRDLLDTLDRTA